MNELELKPTYWASVSGGKDSLFSVWQRNPKYNTKYRMKRIEEMLNKEDNV